MTERLIGVWSGRLVLFDEAGAAIPDLALPPNVDPTQLAAFRMTYKFRYNSRLEIEIEAGSTRTNTEASWQVVTVEEPRATIEIRTKPVTGSGDAISRFEVVFESEDRFRRVYGDKQGTESVFERVVH